MKNKTTTLCKVLALLTGSLLLLLTNAYGAEPIRIGLSLGLTGQYREPAKMQAMGYRLWEKHINQRGGLLGRPVFLKIWDDQSNSDRALKIYQTFLSTQQVYQQVVRPVEIVFGPYSSNLTKAIASTVDLAGYPMIVSGAAASEIWEKKERADEKRALARLTPAAWKAWWLDGLTTLFNDKRGPHLLDSSAQRSYRQNIFAIDVPASRYAGEHQKAGG